MKNVTLYKIVIILFAASVASSGAVVSAATTLVGNVQFGGNLIVTGALSKGSGTFVIDYPLDPKNKLLFHSFVESPDVKNIYDGVATLDPTGKVKIKLPEYFDALNKDARYQFFPHKTPMPNLYIKQEVTDNYFIIAGGVPNGRISWQVTGIRKDPYILANPIVPIVEKGPDQLVKKGEYIFDGYKAIEKKRKRDSERISIFELVSRWFSKELRK